MKSIKMFALFALFSSSAHAGVIPDVPAEASLGGDTLYVSSDAADVIYDRLAVTEVVDATSQLRPIFIKRASGIECSRHMNGQPTMCTIKLDSSGIVR